MLQLRPRPKFHSVPLCGYPFPTCLPFFVSLLANSFKVHNKGLCHREHIQKVFDWNELKQKLLEKFTPIGSHTNENFNLLKSIFEVTKCQEITFVRTVAGNIKEKVEKKRFCRRRMLSFGIYLDSPVYNILNHVNIKYESRSGQLHKVSLFT